MGTDRVTFVGHSTVLLEIGGTRILTDPLLRPRFLHARRLTPPPGPELLEGLDALLVSHLHMDHLDFPSIRRLDRATPVIAPRGSGRVLRRRRFRDVTELSPGESTSIDGVEVTAIYAEHDGRRWPVGPRVPALGYDIRGSSRVYFAGDTDLFDEMSELSGGVDVALLPIGGWGPNVGSGHLDGPQAADAAAMFAPRIVVPIHWGTYLRSDLVDRRTDLVSEPPRKLAERMHEVAPEVEVRILQPGESLELGGP